MGKIRPLILLPALFLILFFMPASLFAGPYDHNLIDTPKAYTSYKGDLRFDFSMYDRGGVLTSAVLAITDYAFLGVYFDIGKMIGSEQVHINQPGVIVRFLISDGSTLLPPIAVGYSYFMKGDVNKINGILVNGFYIVASQGYFLFGNEQSFIYGLRYPIVPLDYAKPENMTFFLGTDIATGPVFSIKGEIENIHFTQERWPETFYNFAFDFNILDVIAIALEFKYSPSIDRMIRLLRIGYTTQF
ncbi:MAG: hypothetical protein AMS17_03215 [Spirochaetes bacterium DG_61]|jgi:hypothetical protein|nr:MAG: hypothetical protein AMS17_03215 [Spirochaetes bacterium DG_61]